MRIYGIDVSHHQGVIDWEQTASELRRVNGGQSPGFAIIRAGYSARSGQGGLVEDGQAKRNLSECNRLGIPCGVYVYCYDQSPAAADKTMRGCLELVKAYRLDYPVIYDVEYEPFNTSCGRAVNTALIKAAMQVVESAGYYGMVYCSRDFFRRHTSLDELTGYDKWEAAYTSADTAAVANGIWQYSSRNALGIAGFGNSLDCDIAYKDYPGIIRAAGLNGLGREKETLYRLLAGPVSAGDLPHFRQALDALEQELGVGYRVEAVS